MSTHRELLAWQQSVRLAKMVYEATARLPKSEAFGLTQQLRRAAVSIASNIAEGAARQSSKEFAQFLSISLGSLAELDTQLEIARLAGLLDIDPPLDDQRLRVAQLTTKLRQSIVARAVRGSRITDHGSRS